MSIPHTIITMSCNMVSITHFIIAIKPNQYPAQPILTTPLSTSPTLSSQEDNPGDVTNEAEMLITAMENEAKAMQLDLSVASVLFEKSKSPYAASMDPQESWVVQRNDNSPPKKFTAVHVSPPKPERDDKPPFNPKKKRPEGVVATGTTAATNNASRATAAAALRQKVNDAAVASSSANSNNNNKPKPTSSKPTRAAGGNDPSHQKQPVNAQPSNPPPTNPLLKAGRRKSSHPVFRQVAPLQDHVSPPQDNNNQNNNNQIHNQLRLIPGYDNR